MWKEWSGYQESLPDVHCIADSAPTVYILLHDGREVIREVKIRELSRSCSH
jgi:hypothetical protein